MLGLWDRGRGKGGNVSAGGNRVRVWSGGGGWSAGWRSISGVPVVRRLYRGIRPRRTRRGWGYSTSRLNAIVAV